MKIILNRDEIYAAIELYTREKCISNNIKGWVISEIKLTCEDDDADATVSVKVMNQSRTAPCAPTAPLPGY